MKLKPIIIIIIINAAGLATDTGRLHQFFATFYAGCKYNSGSSSRLLHVFAFILTKTQSLTVDAVVPPTN